MTTIWTDERIETLRKLWSDGLSASQIADRFDGMTRNAVIGKLHRLGAPGRPRPALSRDPAARKPDSDSGGAPPAKAALLARTDRDAAVGPVAERAEEPGLATTTTLQAHMCRWPIGDPAEHDFSFCGRSAVAGRPYCARHAGAAYQARAARPKGDIPPELSRLAARYA